VEYANVISLVVLSVLAQGYYTPREAQEIFNRAGEAYYREDYPAAKQEYLKLLSHGFGGADVLYNLGTTCLNQGDLGDAVLYLERARRFGGSTSDIEANLAVARSRQLDQVVGGSDEVFVERVANAVRERSVSFAFLIAWSVGFLVLLLARYLPGRRQVVGRALAALLILMGVISGSLLLVHASVRAAYNDAVVIAKSLPAREFPGEIGKVSFEIHAGLKVRVLEASGRYVKIRLPNGLEGWAARESISSI
jgi:hypothetical protein